jgi:acetyltransferase
VYGTNLQGETVLGIETVADIAELPTMRSTWSSCAHRRPRTRPPPGVRRQGCEGGLPHERRIREAGEEGRRAEDELVALADELGILLAGPNGQGVVSTPADLCAQIVAPYPPPGRIGVASQSGNFVSSFLNYARQTGVGISRAVSAGNAAAVTPVTTSSGTRTTTRRRCRSRTSRESSTDARSSTVS